MFIHRIKVWCRLKLFRSPDICVVLLAERLAEGWQPSVVLKQTHPLEERLAVSWKCPRRAYGTMVWNPCSHPLVVSMDPTIVWNARFVSGTCNSSSSICRAWSAYYSSDKSKPPLLLTAHESNIHRWGVYNERKETWNIGHPGAGKPQMELW